ncbi:GNAT family N-acetyltransferase [Flavobacterium sp. NKUCC04_CG]|uniref:GNAT family N-acetyltransferase n=1 Tax=Flavobacterium sp. NKUCC04_CG TaxID=2842121 RepID=UPI001C5B3ED5|nr:GNAT family N-acetyltransferase [Flavobacterium sp. NKUCC04_CG]MBW3518841.1 GNAT family N-acetyltransferase [Flavobacterium sp. NKUCC04_CG]
MNDDFRIEIKPFKDLLPIEVYRILQLRSEVFVVEQNCVYGDIDDKDFDAEHLMIWKGDDLASYARIFDLGIYFDNAASIGRVIVNPKYRSFGLGHQLIKQCLEQIETEYQVQTTDISAQEYLQKFYEGHGFVKISEMYLEDDIPHIHMRRVVG